MTIEPACGRAGVEDILEFPFPGDVRVDPDPRYARLRAEQPICPVRVTGGTRAWLITRYDDAKSVLTNSHFTRGDTLDETTVQAMGVAGPAGRTALIYADPPVLTESRKLIARYFTARRVEALRPRAQHIVDGLIDAMIADGGPVDLLERFARPLPIRIICELLGLPVADSDRIRRSVEVLMSVQGRAMEQVRDAFGFIYGYLGDFVAALRGEPAAGLLCDLAYAENSGEPLTDAELVGLAMLLFVTGHETTMTQIVNSCLVLLRCDEQRQFLSRGREVIESAVEELLRFVPLGHAGLPFAASADLEFGGVRMCKGDLVFVSKLSANRDESAFERAGELDLLRSPNNHIAFSHGPHYCLGAGLARMEMQVAFGTLFTRLPGLRLAVDESELTWRAGSIQRGPESLPVTW
jgi:cytochrome P450